MKDVIFEFAARKKFDSNFFTSLFCVNPRVDFGHATFPRGPNDNVPVPKNLHLYPSKC